MTHPVSDNGHGAKTETLKVVILNDSSIAKGGATGLALLSAQLLRDRNIDTTFISGDAGDDGALTAQGVEMIPMGGKLLLDNGVLQTMKNGLYNKAIRNRISAHIAAHDTPQTVYHLHGWSRILSPSVFDALRPVAARTFIHAHDFFLACPNGAFYDFRKDQVCNRTPLSGSCVATACDRRSYHHKIWRVARSGVLRRTFDQKSPWAGVLTLHDKMAEPLARGGVSMPLIKTVTNPAKPFIANRIQAENNTTFCFIGRVESGKGVNTLCAAAKIANVPLRVIGDGALLEKLKLAHPEVSFTGWVDQNEIGAHLADVRALVMPSRTPEPFGLVAAEASMSGLPVVVSQQALLSSEITAHGLGYSVDTSRVENLADVLKQVAALPAADLRQMSERGFDVTGSIALSPDVWITRLLKLYRGTH